MSPISDFLPFDIEGFDKSRIPLYVWAMVLIGVVGALIIYATR